MMLVDSHCHLDGEEFASDRDGAVARAVDAGVEIMVAIGTGGGPADLETGLRMAERYPQFLATAGIHPHDAAKASPECFKHLPALLLHPKVIAVGEIGLDYHYDFSPREVQHAVFLEQMAIAADARKPIVIHTREAWDDTFALLERHWKPHGIPGVMHCFSGGPKEALRALELGFYLSFGGIVTYPKAVEVHQAARQAPLDRVLLETDSPYLAPVPKRGKRNEPAFLAFTAQRLADLRGESVEALAAATTSNFRRLFA
jgi:TatD DNase family protein